MWSCLLVFGDKGPRFESSARTAKGSRGVGYRDHKLSQKVSLVYHDFFIVCKWCFLLFFTDHGSHFESSARTAKGSRGVGYREKTSIELSSINRML